MVVTFVYGSLEYVCATLDKRRLNKQATEALQLIQALDRIAQATAPEEIKKIGYANHPITRMWEGYLPALQYYYNATLVAHRNRRGPAPGSSAPTTPEKRTLFPFSEIQLANILYDTVDAYLERNGAPFVPTLLPNGDPPIVFPWWFRWHPVIASHWASLLRKDPAYYRVLYNALPDETRRSIDPFLESGYVWTNKLTVDQVRDFKLEYCAPIGTGAPANYRWTREEVLQWMANPLQNPKTKRSIKEGKTGIYGDLMKAKRLYNLDLI